MKHQELDELERQVLDFCQQEGLLPSSGTVLVALSGGADSMCLLTVMQTITQTLGLSLAAAHFHHGLRGEEADRDAAFVVDWCSDYEIHCYLTWGDVAGTAERRHAGVEETGRQLRYEALQNTARRLGGAVIATAHHGEDQVETVLHHLVRGSGLQGLAGIPPRRENIIRPLLGVSRKQILDYNRRHHIPHVEDSTNADPAYVRNRLRHQVVPLLEALNPRLTQGIRRTTESLRRDNQLLEQLTRERVLPYLRVEPHQVSLPVVVLNDLPEALKPRGVQLMAARLGTREVLSSRHRQAVVELAKADAPSGRLTLPGGLVAQRAYRTLILCIPQPVTDPAEGVLPLPGQLHWRGWVISAQPAVYQGERQTAFSFWIRGEGDALRVRTRQQGDTFAPVGRSRKTLKRWLIDEKIPAHRRDQVPVLEQNGTICGILGLGAERSAHPAVGENAWHITAAADTPLRSY